MPHSGDVVLAMGCKLHLEDFVECGSEGHDPRCKIRPSIVVETNQPEGLAVIPLTSTDLHRSPVVLPREMGLRYDSALCGADLRYLRPSDVLRTVAHVSLDSVRQYVQEALPRLLKDPAWRDCLALMFQDVMVAT